MNSTNITQHFPDSEVFIIHQDGSRLSGVTKGAHVVLHTRQGEKEPCCAELISGNLHAEIGLWFERGELCDYDGVFSLPREIGKVLRDGGYIVPEDCFG